jgi:hypothetical protein
MNLTTRLAEAAGIACSGAMAELANAPDTDIRAPTTPTDPKSFKSGIERLAKGLTALVSDGTAADRLREAQQALDLVLEWHFPISRSTGTVVAGSDEASQKMRDATKSCGTKEGLKAAFTAFSEGLHPFQDSYSHEGGPTLGVAGGHGQATLTIPNLLAVVQGKSEKDILVKIQGIFAAPFTTSDQVKPQKDKVLAMAKKTYSFMLEFRDKCGHCLCPDGKTKIAGPNRARNWNEVQGMVESALMFPDTPKNGWFSGTWTFE